MYEIIVNADIIKLNAHNLAVNRRELITYSITHYKYIKFETILIQSNAYSIDTI